MYITNALNSSVNTFGYTPEEIMFGCTSTEPRQLMDVTLQTQNPEDTITHILEQAQNARQKYNQAKIQKELTNKTFKNQELVSKKFSKGDLVLHRQLQVSIGPGTKWSPVFNGPLVITDLQPNEHTATCQNLQTGKIIKAHFTNLTFYRYDDKTLMNTEGATDECRLYK